jgi:hypothetical protein
MSVHKDIQLATQAEVDRATKKAKNAADVAAAKNTAYQTSQGELATAETADTTARDAWTVAKLRRAC